jgi:type II secretion system protein I
MNFNRRKITIKPAKAFTFIEVMMALAVVAISLLALLRLHIGSLAVAETAEITSQAALLADEKIAETLALGYPDIATDSGDVESNGLTLHWQTQVTDISLPALDSRGDSAMRRIQVDITWNQGRNQKHLQTSTCVADRKLK